MTIMRNANCVGAQALNLEKQNNTGYQDDGELLFSTGSRQSPAVKRLGTEIFIDSMRLDIILADDMEPQTVGRPWITIAFDVDRSLIRGYEISFDALSERIIALSLINAILPTAKSMALANAQGLEMAWGMPSVLYLDNATSSIRKLKYGCALHGIEVRRDCVMPRRIKADVERFFWRLSQSVRCFTQGRVHNKHNALLKNFDLSLASKAEFEDYLMGCFTVGGKKGVALSVGVSSSSESVSNPYENTGVLNASGKIQVPGKDRLLQDFLLV